MKKKRNTILLSSALALGVVGAQVALTPPTAPRVLAVNKITSQEKLSEEELINKYLMIDEAEQRGNVGLFDDVIDVIDWGYDYRYFDIMREGRYEYEFDSGTQTPLPYKPYIQIKLKENVKAGSVAQISYYVTGRDLLSGGFEELPATHLDTPFFGLRSRESAGSYHANKKILEDGSSIFPIKIDGIHVGDMYTHKGYIIFNENASKLIGKPFKVYFTERKLVGMTKHKISLFNPAHSSLYLHREDAELEGALILSLFNQGKKVKITDNKDFLPAFLSTYENRLVSPDTRFDLRDDKKVNDYYALNQVYKIDDGEETELAGYTHLQNLYHYIDFTKKGKNYSAMKYGEEIKAEVGRVHHYLLDKPKDIFFEIPTGDELYNNFYMALSEGYDIPVTGNGNYIKTHKLITDINDIKKYFEIKVEEVEKDYIPHKFLEYTIKPTREYIDDLQYHTDVRLGFKTQLKINNYVDKKNEALLVKTLDKKDYTQYLPYQVIEEEDSSLPKGKRVIKRKGTPGKVIREARLMYTPEGRGKTTTNSYQYDFFDKVLGPEISRTEPVDEIVLVGTSETAVEMTPEEQVQELVETVKQLIQDNANSAEKDKENQQAIKELVDKMNELTTNQTQSDAKKDKQIQDLMNKIDQLVADNKNQSENSANNNQAIQELIKKIDGLVDKVGDGSAQSNPQVNELMKKIDELIKGNTSQAENSAENNKLIQDLINKMNGLTEKSEKTDKNLQDLINKINQLVEGNSSQAEKENENNKLIQDLIKKMDGLVDKGTADEKKQQKLSEDIAKILTDSAKNNEQAEKNNQAINDLTKKLGDLSFENKQNSNAVKENNQLMKDLLKKMDDILKNNSSNKNDNSQANKKLEDKINELVNSNAAKDKENEERLKKILDQMDKLAKKKDSSTSKEEDKIVGEIDDLIQKDKKKDTLSPDEIKKENQRLLNELLGHVKKLKEDNLKNPEAKAENDKLIEALMKRIGDLLNDGANQKLSDPNVLKQLEALEKEVAGQMDDILNRKDKDGNDLSDKKRGELTENLVNDINKALDKAFNQNSETKEQLSPEQIKKESQDLINKLLGHIKDLKADNLKNPKAKAENDKLIQALIDRLGDILNKDGDKLSELNTLKKLQDLEDSVAGQMKQILDRKDKKGNPISDEKRSQMTSDLIAEMNKALDEIFEESSSTSNNKKENQEVVKATSQSKNKTKDGKLKPTGLTAVGTGLLSFLSVIGAYVGVKKKEE